MTEHDLRQQLFALLENANSLQEAIAAASCTTPIRSATPKRH